MEFIRPADIDQAVSALKVEGAAVIAGGTDMMVDVRSGKRSPALLVDISALPLKYIKTEGDDLVIGALCTFAQIASDDKVKELAPVLAEAVLSVGSPQIRSRGTIGGNIMNASPAADSLSTLAALDAKCVLVGPEGTREVPLTELITGAYRTDAKRELLTEVRFAPPKTAKMAFGKVGRRNALAIARLNGACIIEGEDKVQSIRLSIGSATSAPMRFTEAEDLLIGRIPDEAIAKEVGQKVTDTILERTGRRASAIYKLPVAADFAARLILDAWRKR